MKNHQKKKKIDLTLMMKLKLPCDVNMSIVFAP